MLAGLLPVDLLARERMNSFRRTAAEDRGTESTEEWLTRRRKESVAEWQRKWTEETETAAWTRRVLPDIDRWMNRMPGLVVSYHLVQSLTGHGYFKAYLHERGRATTPHCLWCPGVVEGVEHTVFDCPKFERHRVETTAILGEKPTPEHTQKVLCGEGDPGNI